MAHRYTNAEDFLRQARERYTFGLEADALDRREGMADNAFTNASDEDKGQWDPEILKARKAAKRPVVQWNRVITSVQQVLNDGRQNKPAIKIDVGDKATKETADFFQSRIRQIEYESNADTAYDTARDQQVISGRGFLRVALEYIPGSFKQRLCVKPIENQFSVVWDPAAQEYDRSDADWCFVISHISKDEHERRYGKQSVVSRLDFASAHNEWPDWIGIGDKGELIQIAEYWVKHYERRTLLLVETTESGPLVLWKHQLQKGEYEAYRQQGLLKAEREENYPVACQYIINGAEILRETELPIPEILIVPQWGRQAVVNGKRRTYSLPRNAKEPQRVLNYEVSNLVEQLAMMPKTPYLAAVGQIPEHLQKCWDEIGSSPVGTLLYNRYDEAARDLGVPARVIQEPPIQGLVTAISQAIDAIKASMGIYDAALGNRSNETSGIAIQRRQNESDVANFHFADNESRTRKRVGQLLVRLIPLLDRPGMDVPVRYEDGKTETVPIGKPYTDHKQGREVVIDPSEGEYGVTVETGPSYTSARQEANERYAALVTAQPELMFIVGDLLLRTDQFPGSQEAADRLKRAIDMRTPGLVEPSPDTPPIPPEAQQAIAVERQKVEKLVELLSEAQAKLESQQPKLENDVRIKKMDIDWRREELKMQLEAEMAKLGSQEAVVELKTDTARIEAERNRHAAQEAAAEARDFELEQADAVRQAEQDAALAPQEA